MSKRGDDTVDNVDLQGNLNLVDAAEQAGVAHFILVSTMGASPDSPVELFRAKGLVEQRLRSSGMVHTILQPTPFMDVWFGMLVELPLHAGWPVTLVGESRHRHSFIAERDVAAIAVAATHTPAARNVTLPIGGPEAVTWLDVVRAYEQAGGRPIEVRSVAPGSPIPGLPEQVAGLAASLETFDSIIPMEATAARFGVTLTSVQEFTRARLPVAGP
jgi:NADH dehydrogenase